MKKIIISLLSFFLLVPSVLAATISSEYQTILSRNESRQLAQVLITSTSDGDITAEHGIRILLSPNYQILFDDVELTITGTAKDNGKVNLNVEPEYALDLKSVFIPVLKDFEPTDWLSIRGLTARAYRDNFDYQRLGLDTNGDGEAEVSDINPYFVRADIIVDVVRPFPIRDVTYNINADGSVTLNWSFPPDYDLDGTIIDRDRIKGGFPLLSTVYTGLDANFTDTDLQDVTHATYYLISRDSTGNHGESVAVEIDFTALAEEPVVEEPVAEEPAVEDPVVSEGEADELSRLLNYYNVRYSIKCMPSGVEVAENNSACLWARIDLIYAQSVTGEDKVAGLALSERDMELMETRRRWPEMRYEDNCITASEPASYCPALGKALDRISYFLD